jgi:hypothetical protein
MISGAMPLRLIRELLGRSDAEIDRLIREDGFPVQEIWGANKASRKVFFHPLLTWLNKTAVNEAWTAEMLDAELERAQRAIELRDEMARARRTPEQQAGIIAKQAEKRQAARQGASTRQPQEAAA